MRLTPTIAWEVLGEGPWPAPPVPAAAELPADSDVLIAGAGITGLSAAMALAAAGRRVVVVDRRIGQGATTRSAGIVVGDTLIGPAPGFQGCEDAFAAWIRQHASGIPFAWTGCWELERDPERRTIPIDWEDAGPVRVSRTVPGGLIDPAALIGAMVTAATSAGATVVDRATLQAYQRVPEGILATTERGDVRCRRLLMATDATSLGAGRDWWPDRSLTVALETEPLTTTQLEDLGWDDPKPFYTNGSPLLWGRLSPSGGMLMGRELVPMTDAAAARLGPAIAAAGERLAWRLRHLHPALNGIHVRRVWAGPIARDIGGVPGIREDADISGAFWAGGYGGHGLAQAFRVGSFAAQRLMAN